MGLFVKEDGHFQGWLAALLCCWAAMSEDEHPIEKRKISKPTSSRNTIWAEQPTPLQPMQLTPITPKDSYKGIEAAFNDDDLVRPISERPPSIKPLDFGDASLYNRMPLHARRKSSTTLLALSSKRISIGKPTEFRRLDPTEKQRKSLVPLQLGPVVLRETNESELALRPTSSKSADLLVDPDFRQSYRASRGTPFERCQQLSSAEPTLAVNERGQILETPKESKPERPALSTQSSSSSIHSLRRQTLEFKTSASPSSSRPSSERSRLKRKRSNLKLSGDSAELDVDKEILELNTIVEERRAEATRPQSPADQHVPAVAPRMPVRARSETLTDIGSAFSKPLISITTSVGPAPEEPTTAQDLSGQTFSPVTPVKSRLSRPFMSMPDPAAVEHVGQQQPIRRPSSRVTGWLSNVLSTSSARSTPTPQAPQQEPFYKCAPAPGPAVVVRRRAVSDASFCTTVTELDSPVLTNTASSPMSRRSHSRSLTAESSRMTPISAPSTVDEDLEPPKWRTHTNQQVGLAL